MSDLQTKIAELQQIVDIQCTDGTWNFNEYHFGLANGLLLALSVLKGEEPEFLAAPTSWLEDDGRDIVTEPISLSEEQILLLALTDPENQPHQWMGDPETLKAAILEAIGGDDE